MTVELYLTMKLLWSVGYLRMFVQNLNMKEKVLAWCQQPQLVLHSLLQAGRQEINRQFNVDLYPSQSGSQERKR